MTDSPSTPLSPLKLKGFQEVPDNAEVAQPSPRFADPAPPTLLIMVDIESLALGPIPVITQVAMLGYDLEEDEYLDISHSHYYPMDPQLNLPRPRKIQGQTIAWWMKQSSDARERFELSTAEDPEDLVALCRNLVTVFNQMTRLHPEYEICAKHPTFDIVAIETLLNDVGLKVPWDHRRVTDVATDSRRALTNPKNVEKPSGFIEHVAYWDARWQVNQYLAARKSRSRG